MRFRDVLELPCLVGARLIAGDAVLDRDVRWVHVIDNPDAATWARPGQFVLTTGYAWPRDDDGLRRLFRSLAAAEVPAVGLAVPQFFEGFPPVVVRLAVELEMILLEVPWEVPFAQVTQEVHTAILGEQARVIERSEAIHRALTRAATSAASLDALARTLAGETALDVAIVSAEGDVLAFTGGEGDRPVLVPLAEATLRRSRGLGDAGAPSAIEDLRRTAEGYAWGVRSAVHVQGSAVAEVWLLGRRGAAGALERRAVEHAALVSALRLAHQRELATVASRLRRSFVDDLLEGRMDAAGLVAERAHVAGFSVRGRYRVALAELDLTLPLARDGFERREAALDRVREMLVGFGAPDLTTTSSNRVFVLLPEGIEADDLWRALGDPGATLVVSAAHAGVEGVRAGFEEARASLRHVPRGGFARYEDLLLPRAVRGEVVAQRALVDQFVQPLAADRAGERLIETLFALARHDFVLKATAAALGVHISTLRHRLERIEDLLGADVRDPDLRLRLRVAGYVKDLAALDPM